MDQIKVVLNFLKRENINIRYRDFKIKISSHPDFPSLLSISDVLLSYGIKNKVISITFEEILNLDSDINLLVNVNLDKDELSNVSYVNGIFHLNNKEIDKEELKKIWSNVILFLDTEDSFSYEEKKRPIKWNLYFIIISFLILITTSETFFRYQNVFYLVTSILGLLICLDYIQSINGKINFISDKFCDLFRTTNCSEYSTNTTKNKFDFIDFVFLYFILKLIIHISLILLNLEDSFHFLLSYGLWFVIPVILISAYLQLKNKKTCPTCLTIIVILLLDFSCMIYNSTNQYEFSIKSIPIVISLILIVLSGYLTLRYLILENKLLSDFKINSLRFIRNPRIFKLILKSNKDVSEIDEHKTFSTGDSKSKLILTFVSSPFCENCENSIKTIQYIINKYGSNVSIKLCFNLELDKIDDKNHLLLINHLTDQYFKNGFISFLDSLSL